MDSESRRIADFSRSGNFLSDDVYFDIELKNGQKFVDVDESTKLYAMLAKYVTLCDVDHDLDQCIQALELMFQLQNANFKKKQDQIVVARSLWRSAVICYGRVAKKSNARKSFKLEPDKVYVGLAHKCRSLHEAIISERDKYQAHADKNSHEATKVSVAIGGSNGIEEGVPILVQGKRGSVPKEERVKEFLEMLSFLKAHLEKLKRDELEACGVTRSNVEFFLSQHRDTV